MENTAHYSAYSLYSHTHIQEYLRKDKEYNTTNEKNRYVIWDGEPPSVFPDCSHGVRQQQL